jgi:transcriptional regulator NrdR family protein
VRRCCHCCARSFATCASAESAAHQVVDEQRESPRNDGAEVAAGVCVAQQVARELELLFERGIGRELDP